MACFAFAPTIGLAAQAPAVGWGYVANIDSNWTTLSVPSNIQHNSCVDSYWAGFRWRTLETADGTYAWSATVDLFINRAIADGKTITIAIKPGSATPAWLYTEDPTAAFSSIANANNADTTTCSAYTVNVPYNATFLTKWNAMIAALKAHLDATFPGTWQPVVKAIMVGGFANQATIMALPYQNAINGIGTGTVSCNGSAAQYQCCSQNDTAAWKAVGYTRLKVRNALLSIAAQYVASFGLNGPKLQLDLSPSNFPPIDDSGNIVSSGPNAQDTVMITDIQRDMVKNGYGQVVQMYNDGMGPTFAPPFIKQDASLMPVGGQAATSEDTLAQQAVSNLAWGVYQYDSYGSNSTGLGNPANQGAVCAYHWIANNTKGRTAP